ncbi:uncharacterized protein CDAR_5031 [Caerostris darwini]|uniref:Gustatory receptor n=1 Tax=Caerostris darwini TaxID=1538125 RepID=A0AAV4P723_9ARAC|nr:uncharacterized protein CDAR_5031 [Caerostris darwini]
MNFDIKKVYEGVPYPEEASKLLQKYNCVLQLMQVIEKELNSISFLLICSQLLNMYRALATYMVLEDPLVFTALKWDFLPAVIVTPLSLVAFILCASKISLNVLNTRNSLQFIYNQLLCKDFIHSKIVDIAKTMLDTEFPKITSCGIMELKPSLIFSVFGTLFTYGLLIRSMS